MPTSLISTPQISVIVPLFNTERYVEKCLRSIMRQTFADIEIICVDDCSPDGSVSIVERLAKEDARIVLIRHSENLGLGGARNTGIRAARADYIASVDSDDYINEDMLGALWEGTKGGYYDVVACGFAKVDQDGNVLSRHFTDEDKTIDPISHSMNPFRISTPSFWGKLWRRSLYTRNNIYFPNYIYHQDSATTPRIYSVAKNVRFIGGDYYNYFIRSDSVTNSISDKHLLDRFRELDVVKEFFLKEGLYERHREYFRDRVFTGYGYHSENVYNNRDGGDEATDRYLRHLLLMREAYMALDDIVRRMSIAEKAAALSTKRSILSPRAARRKSRVVVRPASAAYPKRSPLTERPRILVLTVYSGENEFERCRASLASQTHDEWDQRLFVDMEKEEARRQLLSAMADDRNRHDLFLKLDADIIPANEEILEDIVDHFREIEDLDHLVVACDDFMSGTRLPGVHVFSNRVRWEGNAHDPSADPTPHYPGRLMVMSTPAYSFFSRSPDPSPLQAMRFGAHCALELVRRRAGGGRGKPAEAVRARWDTLLNVWLRFEAHGDRRRALALLAADLVLNGDLRQNADSFRDPGLLAAYEKYAPFTTARIEDIVRPVWGDEGARERNFGRAAAAAGLEGLALETGNGKEEAPALLSLEL